MQSNDIIAVLSSNEGIRFIQNNLNKDPVVLALKYAGKTSFDLKVALQLITIYRKAAQKSPIISKNLLAVEKSEMEFYLLTIEAQLSQVAKILGTERISDRSISSQIQWIKNTSSDVMKENSELSDMIVKLEAELTKTAVANQDNIRKNNSVTSSLSDLLNAREVLIEELEQSLAQMEITNIREAGLIKDKLDASMALNNKLNREIEALKLNFKSDKATAKLALQELKLTHQREIENLQEQLSNPETK